MDWNLPEKRMFCLVGRGDSTKSTILEAIRYVFYPQWNLSFDDADFHGCIHTNTITIEAVVTGIPDEFRDLASYGHHLCGWNAVTQQRENEPGEGLEDAIRVRLRVDGDLEPVWSVTKADSDDGTHFKTSDRLKAAVSLIGAYSDRQLTWGRGSILCQLTKSDDITASLAEAGRAAKAALESRRTQDLKNFDAVAQTAEQTAKSLGVVVSSSYKAQLDSDAVNVRMGGLSLHDGEMPLRQLGMGSKRMLTTGLQKQALQRPHITLCDELEIALEPHRIARLVHHIKEDVTGQYFVSTHSPVVLRELTVDDIYIVHCRGGSTEVVAANKPAIADSIQGKIRLGAEAFLAPKIVVCEGATEVGFLRGLDRHWSARSAKSFAYQGVAMFDANGASKVREIAEGLKDLHYEVSVLVDSDRADQFSEQDAIDLRAKDITVAMWQGKVSIEERVFSDLPWNGVLASLQVAREIVGDDEKIVQQVETQYGAGFNRDQSAWIDDVRLRTAIGKAANASDWYKRQSWAFEWTNAIAQYLDDRSLQSSDLVAQLKTLRTWIDRV